MNAQDEEKRFHRDWQIDFGKKVISRKKRTLMRKMAEAIFQPKYPVIALYRFGRHHEATSVGIVFPEIVDGDMLPKIDEIPTRYVLNDPWRIPDFDQKTLYLGPLTQETTVLVPAFPKGGFFATVWDVVRVISTIGGAVGLIVWLISVFN